MKGSVETLHTQNQIKNKATSEHNQEKMGCCVRLVQALMSNYFCNFILPKILYFILEFTFLILLIIFNWDYLTGEEEQEYEGTIYEETEQNGPVVLLVTAVLTVGTVVFYLLTGCVDPGYVHLKVWQTNNMETFESQADHDPTAGVQPGQ